LCRLELVFGDERVDHRDGTAWIESIAGLGKQTLDATLRSKARVAELMHALANDGLHRLDDAPPLASRGLDLRNASGNAERFAELVEVHDADQVTLIVLHDEREAIGVDPA
jgi:hypothetical protein